jgi:hypothetical protein
MKAKIIEQSAIVYSDPDSSSPLIAELGVGTEFELGAVKRADGREWVAVTFADGRHGYISGATKIFSIKHATLLQDEVEVRAQPAADSAVVKCYHKNDVFHMTEHVSQNDSAWIKVRDEAGNEGFIDGETQIRVDEEAEPASKESGQKNMLVGALWCIGGIVVTAVTYSNASTSGGTYFVAWGPVLFGGIQFLKGLFQVATAAE